jgi:hypothetical protein
MPQKFACLFSLIAFTCWHTPQPAYQKINLDEHYNTIVRKEQAKNILRYKIKHGKGLVLDSKAFDFSAIKKMNDGKMPDRIHLLAPGGVYDFDLNTAGETILDASTAEIMKADRPFPGFEMSKDKYFLGIGSIKHTEAREEMMTYWVASIDVE